MGYVVFHLDKSPGNESAMTDHIERKVIHPNVDPDRIHLNKELVEFPDGIKDRTEAIQHRLETAGLKRQIGKNQVKVIRVMISGSPEDMKRIESEGKLDDWCRDNIHYLKNTFGEDNLVAATLHMDETTPHIHASIVPIVRGERRQKKPKKKQQEGNQTQNPNEEQKAKRAYKKKDPNRPRLCVDDVMAREKLIEYQDTYAVAMAKYGLKRGIKGSDARHITLTEHYRNQTIERNNLQINIEQLLAVEEAKRQRIEELKQKEQEAKLKSIQAEEQKQQKESELKKTEESLNQVKGQLKTEELKSKVANVGSNIMDGIGSMIGISKVKQLQQEIDDLKKEKKSQQQEITILNQTITRERKENEQKTRELKVELNKIYDWLPETKSLVNWGEYCKNIGFSDSQAKDLVNMRPIYFSGELYSKEHSQRFKAHNSEFRLEKDIKRGIFSLLINKIDIFDWFKQKHREFLEAIGIRPKQRLEAEQSNSFRI